jgi:predicted nucleic acid-binding protein
VARICLDTSAYSAFKRGDDGVREALARAERIVLPPIVLGELFGGVRTGGRETKNREELGRFLASPRVDVVTVDEETAERYGEIFAYLRAAGTPIPTNDIWIAATAMQWGLRVHTTDSHFERVPQVVVERHSV